MCKSSKVVIVVRSYQLFALGTNTQNFCLQSNVKKANVKILKNFDEAIIVDAASLDPESLYQRTYAG